MKNTKTNTIDSPQFLHRKNLWKVAVLLFLGVLIYTIPATFFLDFIRDTEADRTLISLEMSQSTNWSVPYLLGQEFMTKPPGFYWAQAISFLATGSNKEWAARLPSAIATAIMVCGLFLFLVRESKPDESLYKPLTTALILATSGAIFRLSIMAEIDMFFTMLVTLAILSGYYTVTKETFKEKCIWAMVFQLFSALAFLTKGPPVLLFGWVPVAVWFFWYRRKPEKSEFFRFSGAHLIGLLVFVGVTGLWVNSVLNKLGTKKVMDHFNYQVVKRVTGEKQEHAGRNRGIFYYFGATAKGSIPWTPFLLLFFYQIAKRKKNEGSFKLQNTEAFALAMIIPSMIGLTATAGKASRYMLPLWPFFAILTSAAITNIPWEEKKRRKLITALVTVVVLLRLPWCLIYAPGRNKKSSPRPVASSIHSLVPQQQNIYILSLMERWIVYYLITEENRNVLRINSEVISTWNPSDDIFIIIHKEHEDWKLQELTKAYPETSVVKEYTQNKRNFRLIKTKASAIDSLQLHTGFLGRK